MTVVERLEALTKAQADVDTATYVDMRSGTVLCSSSGGEQPQEQLDALCETAKSCLDSPVGQSDEAIIMKSTEVIYCLRSAANPVEALCLVCAPAVPVAEAAAWARNLVTDLRE